LKQFVVGAREGRLLPGAQIRIAPGQRPEDVERWFERRAAPRGGGGARGLAGDGEGLRRL
jgi:hypothetical protein